MPDLKRIMVFKRGTWLGLKGEIPMGGHCDPSSGAGLSLMWKNAQKNDKKKNTSEIINRIMPHRRPLAVNIECRPWKELSRAMSRHHWKEMSVIIISLKIRRIGLEVCIHFVRPVVSIRDPRAAEMGHGLWSTMWNECLLLISIYNSLA